MVTSLADDSLTTGWIWLHQPAHTLPQRPALCLLNPWKKRPGWADGNWQFSPIVASNLPFLHLLLADILNILFYLFGCAGSWVFPGGLEGKESACSAGDLGSVPGSGRSLGGGHGNSLQYSCLENPRGRGAWWALFQGVTKCQTQLNPLSMLGLSCCTQGLWFSLWHVDLCVCVFQLWHVESLVVTYELLVATCGIKFPEQGLNPGLLHWELGVLATGPPGKSQLPADLADMDSTQRNQRGTPPAPRPCYTANLAFREEVTC